MSSSRLPRPRSRLSALTLLVLPAIGLLALAAAACGSPAPRAASPPAAVSDAIPEKFMVYASPDCDCCAGYVAFLEAAGLQVDRVDSHDLPEMKASMGIPRDAWSCHTAVVGDYVIEGHVPLEAIGKLFEERPDIDGLALPGMPPGSPGMGGEQTEPLVIYAVSDSTLTEFARY